MMRWATKHFLTRLSTFSGAVMIDDGIAGLKRHTGRTYQIDASYLCSLNPQHFKLAGSYV